MPKSKDERTNKDQQGNSSLTSEQRATLQHRCKTDLYFLAKDVLGYKDMVPHVHGKMCATYVQKDPSKGIFEQADVRTRMILAPRGTFKTCVDIADIIQWILCFPNIRILILTGTQELAHRMVAEIKTHFQTNDALRQLFPEWCPPRNKKWGTDDEFTTPARKAVLREPTVSSSTIGSVKAGIHVELVCADDIVNEINSHTDEQVQKVVEAYDSLTYLLEPGGFTNINGTRYKPNDLYGRLLKRQEDDEKRAASGVVVDEDDDPEEILQMDFKSLILAAWTVKPFRDIPRDASGVMILKKGDLDLLFPERQGFRTLYKQYRDNPGQFTSQMLQNPSMAEGSERPFTAHLIDRHVIPHDQFPHPSTCRDFIMWDLAGVNQAKGDTDYSVGVVGRLGPDKRLYIIDMVRGKWNATQLATQIVTLARNYSTAPFTWIEDAQGARYLEPTIHGIAAQYGISTPIQWVKVPRFGGAKRYRIDSLAQFFQGDRLWLASYLPYLDALRAELLDRNPLHDDCSDAVALLVKELGLSAGAVATDAIKAITKKEIADRMFAAAIYGEDDGRYVVEAPTVSNEAPQVYDCSILGYGFGK